MNNPSKVIALNPMNTGATGQKDAESAVLSMPNTSPAVSALEGISPSRIELQFPKFSDGRAFSQATLLRRAGYEGDIRATGDVLVDQLQQMQRCGFSSAKLRDDQNPEHAVQLLALFGGFYQGHYQGDLRVAAAA